MSIELRHLRYAVAAAQRGSISRAAVALGVKPSSLSRGIKQLEDQLDVTVFLRTPTGLTLTAAGAEILRTSRHLVEDVDHMVLSAKAAGSSAPDRLSIGFYTSLSAGNLRAILVEFTKRFPEVDVRLVEAERDRLLIALEHGTLDVAIVTGDSIDHEGDAMPLWSERIAVALLVNHPLAVNDIVYWTDLREETVVLSERDPGPDMRDMLLLKLQSRGARPQITSKDVSSVIVMSLVGAGCGISLTVESAFGVAQDQVCYRKLHDGTGASYINYHACWRSRAGVAANRPALSKFLRLLDERYPSLPAMTVNPGGPSRTPDRSP